MRRREEGFTQGPKVFAPRFFLAALAVLAVGADTRREQGSFPVQLVENLKALEHFAETEATESAAIYVSFPALEQGDFVEFEQGHWRSSGTTSTVTISNTLIADRITEMHRSLSRSERNKTSIDILFLHTHQSSMADSPAYQNDPLVQGIRRQGQVLTSPPGHTDIRLTRGGEGERFLELLSSELRSRVRVRDAVVDEAFTYFFHRMSPDERRSKGLEPFSFSPHDSSSLVAEYPALGEVSNFIHSLDPETRMSVGYLSSPQSFVEAFVYESQELRVLNQLLRDRGQGGLADAFTVAGREIKNYQSGARLDEIQSRWIAYVASARARGDAWSSIITSTEYRELRDFCARYYNTDLQVVPNEELTPDLLRRMGYR